MPHGRYRMKSTEFLLEALTRPVAIGLGIGLLSVSAALAAAPPVQSLAAIDAVVRQHIAASLEPEAEIDVQVGRLDPRLRLANCDQPLVANDARAGQDGAASSVEVRCDGSQPWSLYVPVTLVRFADVVVAALSAATQRRGHDGRSAARPAARESLRRGLLHGTRAGRWPHRGPRDRQRTDARRR